MQIVNFITVATNQSVTIILFLTSFLYNEDIKGLVIVFSYCKNAEKKQLRKLLQLQCKLNVDSISTIMGNFGLVEMKEENFPYPGNFITIDKQYEEFYKENKSKGKLIIRPLFQLSLAMQVSS